MKIRLKSLLELVDNNEYILRQLSMCDKELDFLDDYGIELDKEDNEVLLLTDEEFEEYCHMLEQTI